MATTKSADLPHLRSVVLAGHSGAGKTTLAEALLFRTGAINRLGRVEDGTTTLDTEPEAQKRHISLSLGVASLDDDGNVVTIVDTPGYPDFVAEVVAGFQAADAAVICMDATGGVEAGAETAVGLGRANRTAALFVINKCDRENAEPGSVVDALRAEFGNKIAPLQVAIGKAETFSGYVDLVHRKAYHWDGRQEVEVPIPAEMEAEVAARRDQLLEAASEVDDDVLTKYLEGAEVSDAELDACLHRGVRDSVLAPVLVASATKGIGLRGLLDAIVRYLPAPSEEPAVIAHDPKTNDPIAVPPDPDGPLLVRVFKTTADPFVGRLTYLRVLSGTLRSQAHTWNAGKAEDERIGQLLRLHGKDQEAVGELRPGEIGAVAKLTATATGDTLSSKERPLSLDRPVYPIPTLVVAIEPQTKADLDKMGPALQRMLEEEPCARVERSATGEQVILAMGETHVAVIGERLKRKFGSAITTHTPRIPYHETLRGRTQVEGKYKKQTGGHGMFGHVWIEIEPNPDGGVAFAERVVGGTVPKNFFPGVEKGIRQAARACWRATRSSTSRPPSTTAPSTRSTRTTCRSRSPRPWRSRRASWTASRCSRSRSWPWRSASPSGSWATSTAISTAAADGCWGWTWAATGCRSSRRTFPRRSCSATRPSCARSRADGAPSRRPWITTRTCRRRSVTRSSRRTARNRSPARTEALPRARSEALSRA
jgi:elongation factor G